MFQLPVDRIGAEVALFVLGVGAVIAILAVVLTLKSK